MIMNEELCLKFETERYIPPSVNRLRAHVQGEIVFIGDYWLNLDEAKALRDWLTKVVEP